MKELAVVILIGILAAVFMFRWDIEAGSGTEGIAATVHFKLDRFTGTSYSCTNNFCSRINRVEDRD